MTVEKLEKTTNRNHNRKHVFRVRRIFFRHLGILAVLPLGIHFHAFGIYGDLQRPRIIGTNGENIRHGPHALDDGPKFLEGG